MKYMLLLTRGEWQDTYSEEQKAKVFGEMMDWWTRMRAEGKIIDANQLQDPGTATTVVLDHGQSVLVDRPLIEAKEAIGGYGLLDVADLDEAIAIAKSYPSPDGKIEVRPVVER